MEKIACNRLLDMIPEQLRRSYGPLILEEDKEVKLLVKAADKLSAYIKCLEEQKAGNSEFGSAANQTWETMRGMDLPELDWFLDNCLGPYFLDLDQL